MDHVNDPDMVRDSGLAYRDTGNDGREVYSPVCLKHRADDGHGVVNIRGPLHVIWKSIG